MMKSNRREFFTQSALFLAATSPIASLANSFEDFQPIARFGLITDLHYADKPASGTRHYRESLPKLAEAAEKFGAAKLDFMVELGDLVDAAPSAKQELEWLERINGEFTKIAKNRHYVLGNHCVQTLTKAEFLGKIGREKSFGSFDVGDLHFVTLDACFRADGEAYGRNNFKWNDANLPADQLDWLKQDLKTAASRKQKTIVFAHQRLDVKTDHGIKNAESARSILEQAGNVLAVFQGHSHDNDLKTISGIHYCTLVAMVEGSGATNNGYSIIEVDQAGSIRIQGFRKQRSFAKLS